MIAGVTVIYTFRNEEQIIMAEIKGMMSIVMPAYNEEKLIYNSIMTTLEVVQQFTEKLELIVVNDGSIDQTKNEILRAKAQDKRIKIVSSEKNRGKGRAIISGITEACGEYIAFLDADLELFPDQLQGYLTEMEQSGVDVVIGCKFHKDSKLKYPLKRKVMSMGYYVMLRILFHLHVKDTQTGIKLFRARALKPVAHLIRTSGFAYDIELLVALHRRGCTIKQMPVHVVYVRERESKRIVFKDVLKAFKDTWIIFGRTYVKHYYDVK